MGDVLQFRHAKWDRLDPLWVQPWEVNCVHYADYFGWEIPRFACLSVFENKWLDHLHGWRHQEVDGYLDATADERGARICMALGWPPELPQNVRWP